VFKLGVGNDIGISYKWYSFGVERSKLGLGLVLAAIRRGFELYEYLLVIYSICRCVLQYCVFVVASLVAQVLVISLFPSIRHQVTSIHKTTGCLLLLITHYPHSSYFGIQM